MMSRTVKGYLFSILSAVVFGSLPAIAKLIYAEGLNPLSLVFSGTHWQSRCYSASSAGKKYPFV